MIAQTCGCLLQPSTLDEPLRRESEPTMDEPLQRTLGQVELVTDLCHPGDVAAGFHERDQSVDEHTLGVYGEKPSQGVTVGLHRGPMRLSGAGRAGHRSADPVDQSLTVGTEDVGHVGEPVGVGGDGRLRDEKTGGWCAHQPDGPAVTCQRGRGQTRRHAVEARVVPGDDDQTHGVLQNLLGCLLAGWYRPDRDPEPL